MTCSMLIIADDLTGAADGGAVGTRLGLSSFVAMDTAAIDLSADVVAIDADTRSMGEAEAAAKVRHLVDAARTNDRCLLFKKVDSTLRGHVGAELAATLSAYRASAAVAAIAVFAPAFPAAGRTTVGGRVFVRGVPLEATELWQREGQGADASPARMVDAAGLSHVLVSLDEVRGGRLSSRMAQLQQVADVLICDAETDGDLAEIAKAGLLLGHDAVWVGSAGLAGHLVRRTGPTPSPGPSFTQAAQDGPCLFVVGSMSSISRDQAAALVDEANVLPLPVPVSRLIEGLDALQQAGWTDQLETDLRSGRDVPFFPRARHRHRPPACAGPARRTGDADDPGRWADRRAVRNGRRDRSCRSGGHGRHWPAFAR